MQTEHLIILSLFQKTMQMYELKELKQFSTPQERKKTSFSTLLSTGRQRDIKKQILNCLNERPMTARQLSETIGCMRSSVCYALKKHTSANIVSDKDSIFDDLTERTVTLYSLVETAKVRILSV